MPDNQPFENNLLREAEGLEFMVRLFKGFDEILEELIDTYGQNIDPQLITCLEIVRYDINLTLSGVIVVDYIRVQGLIKQLDDVMDEIQVFQAGLKTKSSAHVAPVRSEKPD